MEETKEMIKIMQHYVDSGEIEVKVKNEDDTRWRPCDCPAWGWTTFEYRIKQQKQEITIEKWLCSDEEGDFVIIETSDIEVYTYYKKIKLLESYKIEL